MVQPAVDDLSAAEGRFSTWSLLPGPGFREGDERPADAEAAWLGTGDEHSQLCHVGVEPLDVDGADHLAVEPSDRQLSAVADRGDVAGIGPFGVVAPDSLLRVGVHPIDQLDDLGRADRRVTATAAGAAIAARGRRVLAELDGARQEVDVLRGVLRGRLRIGPLVPAGDVDVPGLLARFSRSLGG